MKHKWRVPGGLDKVLIALLFLLASASRINAQSDPNQGPGGPILVITSSSSTFGKYYAEILRTEGLNEFAVLDIGSVTATTLTAYDVVILAPAALTAGQVGMLSDWVTGGGNLIAMQPDAQLNSLLGLTSAGSTLSNVDLLVDTSTLSGNGIVNQVIQFHGAANRYTLSGASSLATLYTNFTTGTSNPAVTIRSVGTSGGHAAAFAYDLATSIVYMRQGNPAWAAQERDGTAPIRPDDKFFGAAVGDPQPDWVDLNDEVAIPQADEQQRFLANLIFQMNLGKKPLPRFWYFPRGKKAVLIMTGDDHGNGGTAGRFDQFISASPAGCNVANWECIRSTSYIFTEPQNLSNAQAASYTAQGFEVGLHINTNCADFTPASLDTFYSQQIAGFNSAYPAVPILFTERHHCIAWSDWITAAKTELKYGMRLDTSYYFWPPGWVQNRPGHFTGSAMPMRFADLDGTIIDVYNATTQMTDESGQTYPFTSDALLSAAVGPQGYYGAFTVNAHTDSASNPVADGTLSSALSRGIPVVSSAQMLKWLDGRNSSSFGNIAWASNTLSFNITLGSGSAGLLQAMVPRHSSAGVLTTITGPSGAVALTIDTIKGVEYAFFSAAAGAYSATYAPDGTAPTVISTSPTAGATGVIQSTVVTATFSEAMDPTTLNVNTFILRNSSNVVVPASISYAAATRTVTLTPTNPLAASATYTANLTPSVKDLSGNALANLTWSFTTAGGPSCPCTIWSSATTPANPSVSDPNSVELGVKFKTDLNGFITGVRFYKGAANTGVHVGNLWNSAGQLLATANFTNETASGWQQVNFSSPVAVTANTVYIASYFTAVGNYAGDNNFFATSGIDNFPLHAIQDGVSGGDGVYAYSVSSTFPTNTYLSSNYWVDVVFTVGNATLTSITVTPANPTIQIGATQQFTATGTYSDNSTQNITGQVAWASSKTSVATITSAGLATAVSAGAATISATQAAVSGSTTLTVAPAPLTITTSSPLPPGTVGGAYSTTLTAAGGTPPYTWSIVTGSGALPGGLTLNAATGSITGTPVASGTFTFTVQVVDSVNPEAPASKAFSITIGAAASLSVTTTAPANGVTGVSTSTTVSATFNNPLNATTITASTFTVKAGATTVSGSYNVSNNVATFTPGSPLAGLTTYTATLTTGVQDVNGSALAANFTWTFTTACTSNCTIWPATAVPTRPDDGPDSPVELGVKFRADSDGRITGIRFYKSTANTGTHVGNLWSSAGNLLASAIFTGETASGWQQVNFVNPVSITAGTVYVASYHSNGGHYADDQNFFAAAGVDNPPLHALQNGVSGFNGAYAYNASSIFPSQGFNSSNYWVDVVYSSAPAPSNTTFLGPTANAPVTVNAGDNNGFETTPANAQTAVDGLFAVDASSGTNTTASCTDAGKDKHDFFNYNVSLPPTATIQGVEVRLDSKVNSTANAPVMCVQVSWNGGTTWTTAQSTPTLTTATATYVFGGPANTLGRTWAVGDFSNANFRVRVIDVAASTARTFSLDWIAVRVTYQ